MVVDRKAIESMYRNLSTKAASRLKKAAEWIVNAKLKGGKVVAVVGSGPNLHEGVTTLIAELIRKGIIDGVLTSSAVINHEMAENDLFPFLIRHFRQNFKAVSSFRIERKYTAVGWIGKVDVVIGINSYIVRFAGLIFRQST